MLRSTKSHSLNLEFLADEGEKIDPGDDHVAPQHASWFVIDSKVRAEFFENFGGEKCGLAFVVFPIIKVTIAAQAVAGHTFHFGYFHEGKLARGPAVVADEVVAGREEDLPDQHRTGKEGLADAETDFADDPGAEALLQFAQNLGLGDLFELIVQGGLKHAHEKNPGSQADRG